MTRPPAGAQDFYIPMALLEDFETHGAGLSVEVVNCGPWMPEQHPELIAERA